jgi:glc operon protein GlcG
MSVSPTDKGSPMRRVLMALMVGVAFTAVGAQAQAAPAAAPAPVPDVAPYDFPFGTPITVARAQQLVQAVIAEATKAPRNWKLAITVVDPNGDLVYFYKMDGTQIGSVLVSQNKAYTAARFRRTTQVFFDQMQVPTGAYVPTLDARLVASPGGIPLVEGGRLIGAIGCSGATGAQDAVACGAGAALVRP